MKTLGWIVAGITWSIALIVYFNLPAPFVDLGGSEIGQATVKPGGTFTITRSLRIKDDTPMRVTRVLMRGDCRKVCDIIDLHSGALTDHKNLRGTALTLKPGTYTNLRREHVMPLSVPPGKWQLVFYIQWDDVIGRERRQALQELEIEVVK